MKSLWTSLRPLLLALAAFSFFINLLFLAPAMFSLQVFDRVISSNSQETLVVLMVGVGVALLILAVLDFVRNRLQNLLGTLIEEHLSPPVLTTVVAKAARTPHAQRSDGIRDVATLRSVFSTNGLIALFDAPWIVVYVAVIWLFHPLLGMGAAASALAMLALAWLNDSASRNTLDDLQRETRRASHYVESSMRNAEILQALGMTQRLLDRWRSQQQRLAELNNHASRAGVAFSAATRFMRQAIQVAMLALGAYLVLTQQASPGIMIATTILLGRAVQPVEQLVGSWRLLAEARGAFERLRALSCDFEASAPRVHLPTSQGGLAVQALSYRPEGSNSLLLSGIEFTLEAGQALAVIGPSGAGKSTLSRLLIGVWAPTTGSVRLDGASLADWPRDDLGPRLGYVPQDVELFDGSVADNIARLGRVDAQAVVAAAQRAHAHELILGLAQGYDTAVGEHGAKLSPGQRQRIALARALYGQPKLVVLDEPNSNLDGAGEAALAQALGALRQQGITSVVVTHRPALVAHVDKILVLDAGRMVQFGAAAEVMKTLQRHAQPQAVPEKVA